MLRVLIRGCMLLVCVYGQSAPVFAGSELPGASEISRQKSVVDETLNEAARLSTTRHFLQDIARSQQSLETLNREAGEHYFQLPENNAQADLQDLWHQAKGDAPEKKRPGIDVPVIFASFSLPEAKLQELLAEAEQVGAMVVLRGLVNDDLNTTLARISEATKQQGTGFVLDPTLFSRFGVEQVPAFLLPLESIQPCDVDDCKTPLHVMASGNVSLFYFLDLVQRTGSASEREVAKRWLAHYGESP